MVDTFIRRPILASVCSLVLILAGAIAIPAAVIALLLALLFVLTALLVAALIIQVIELIRHALRRKATPEDAPLPDLGPRHPPTRPGPPPQIGPKPAPPQIGPRPAPPQVGPRPGPRTGPKADPKVDPKPRPKPEPDDKPPPLGPDILPPEGEVDRRGCRYTPIGMQFGRYPCHADYARSVSGDRREFRVTTPEGISMDFDAMDHGRHLYEVKTGYSWMWSSSPGMRERIERTRHRFIRQSEDQLLVAERCGRPLTWYFNERSAARYFNEVQPLQPPVIHRPFDCDADSDG